MATHGLIEFVEPGAKESTKLYACHDGYVMDNFPILLALPFFTVKGHEDTIINQVVRNDEHVIGHFQTASLVENIARDFRKHTGTGLEDGLGLTHGLLEAYNTCVNALPYNVDIYTLPSKFIAVNAPQWIPVPFDTEEKKLSGWTSPDDVDITVTADTGRNPIFTVSAVTDDTAPFEEKAEALNDALAPFVPYVIDILDLSDGTKRVSVSYSFDFVACILLTRGVMRNRAIFRELPEAGARLEHSKAFIGLSPDDEITGIRPNFPTRAINSNIEESLAKISEDEFGIFWQCACNIALNLGMDTELEMFSMAFFTKHADEELEKTLTALVAHSSPASHKKLTKARDTVQKALLERKNSGEAISHKSI